MMTKSESYRLALELGFSTFKHEGIDYRITTTGYAPINPEKYSHRPDGRVARAKHQQFLLGVDKKRTAPSDNIFELVY